MEYSEMIGKKFGKLTVVGFCRINRKSYPIRGVKCKCDCGNDYEGAYYNVRDGISTSCGCNYRLQLVGKRFGILTVIERVTIGVNSNLFKCVCDCGNERVIVAGELSRGNHKSCGCKMGKPITTKEFRDHPLYDVWKGMKARCRDKKHRAYPNYGGKGVKVCSEWQKDFFSFYNWAIDNGYKKGLQIDKDIKAKAAGLIPNIYSPERCQFVTPFDNIVLKTI